MSSSRAYPLPPDVAAGRNPTALIDQTAQVFRQHGNPELSTGDLTEWAAVVRRFMFGQPTQVDGRLAVDPEPGQCPRCFGRHGQDPRIAQGFDEQGRQIFWCRPCDRQFGARVPDPTEVP